ncbi:hypothetical protein ABS735_28670 [Streptomyces sp. MMCC 100]|uniref:hypothetical protein n=1 Tax=Streptomyces sp. MMCC 100 TaxID=3163555 RepID=UPI003594AF02
MKHDYLKTGALLAALVATASAEYELARAVGFNQWVAAAVPGALDIYTVRAMRAHRDVLAAVAAMIGVNAASHLVTAGLLPVDWPLVVAVAAIAPLVLWRVHRLADVPDEQPVDTPVEYAPVPEPEPVPEAHPVIPEAVPDGARLLPIVARPAPEQRALVLAADEPRTRVEVRAEYVPEAPEPDVPDPLAAYGLGDTAQQFRGELLAGEVPSIRSIKDRVRCGQPRAEALQNAFRAFVERQEVRA